MSHNCAGLSSTQFTQNASGAPSTRNRRLFTYSIYDVTCYFQRRRLLVLVHYLHCHGKKQPLSFLKNQSIFQSHFIEICAAVQLCKKTDAQTDRVNFVLIILVWVLVTNYVLYCLHLAIRCYLIGFHFLGSFYESRI